MAITTVSDLNGLYNNIYERSLFVAREMNIMTNLVRQFSATGFMVRKFSVRPTVTAQVKAEGVDFANPTTFGKDHLATLTPATVMAQALLTDEDRDTDPDGAINDAAQEMGGAVATKIDVDLCADFASFTTDVGPGAGQTATIAKAAVAVSVLRNRKAPNPIYSVWHPYHWHDLWVELGQPATTKAFLGDVANQALKDFYVGNWINVQHFVNANIAVDGSDDAVSGIFNQNSLGFDSRQAPMLEPERDASRKATELNMSAAYAHGVIRETYGVKYTADAATPA
jgi:hypothetical protein